MADLSAKAIRTLALSLAPALAHHDRDKAKHHKKQGPAGCCPALERNL